MPNSILIANNTSATPQHWDVDYVVDEAGVVTTTLETAGTLLDRHIQVTVTTPGAEFTTSEQSVYVSTPGWVNSGSPSNPIWSVSTGVISATTAALSNPTAMMAPTGFTTTSEGSYYVTLNTTAGSVTPRAVVTTTGYVSSAQNTNAAAISMPVSGSGDKLYIASNTIIGSVYDLQSGSVAITTSITGMSTASSNTGHSITIGSTITSGSVKGKATAGNTTGIVASGASNISTSSTITPNVTGTTTIYIPNATHTLSGGGLTAGAGSASISVTCGYFDGTNYTNGDRVTLSTAETTGYYKLQAFGSGSVTRAAITSEVTEGYTNADTSSIAQETINSTNGITNYYLKKSTLSAQSVNSSSEAQTITVSSGYHPDDRTITVNAMTSGSVTPAYNQTGMSTYFNSTASDGNVTITPKYTNTAGYISEHNNTTGGTVGRWNIKTTYLDTNSITKVNPGAPDKTDRAAATIYSNGWITAQTIDPAIFSNQPLNSKVEYVDISDTTEAPILISNDYLYINRGFVDDLKISLAKLVPDGASSALAGGHILSGYSAYNNDGQLIAGTITSKGATIYNTSSSDQVISSGQYLSGNQTIRAVTTSGISAGNIKAGTTVLVGDSNTSGRIANVTGTFTDPSTVSTGQTAATSAQIVQGYSAWVDGEELQGTIVAKTTGNITENFTSTTGYINIPAGVYSPTSSFTLTCGAYNADSSTSSNSTVSVDIDITSASAYGFVTSSAGLGTYLTISPDTTATSWSVTPRANITASGYISFGSKTGTAVSNTPTINEGSTYYVPVVTPSFEGGTVSATISSNVISTNMTTASTSTYYIDATAAGTYSKSAVTYSNSSGVIAAHSSSVASSAINTTSMADKAATRIYIPASSATMSGGTLTVGSYTDISTITLASNNNSNMSNTRLGSLSTATYPYYFEIKGNTSALSSSIPVSVGANTASFTTGYIEAGEIVAESSEDTCEVSIQAASASTYFSLKAATASLSGSNAITASAELTTANIYFSEADTGIAVTAVGGGAATATVSATTDTEGYAASGLALGSTTVSGSNSTSTTAYVVGVKLEAPASGTRSFFISVPNGSTADFIDFVFTVDSSGNVFIDDGT